MKTSIKIIRAIAYNHLASGKDQERN